MKSRTGYIFPCILGIILCCAVGAFGQTTKTKTGFHFKKKKKKELPLPVPEAPDRKFIADYHRDFTARAFGSRKFYNYGLYDKGFSENLKYKPNTPFNIGLGFNYRILGVNIGFNAPIINDTKLYGPTKYLDIQSHLYGRSLTMDVYFQRYKGFYLANEDFLQPQAAAAPYLRPDLKTLNFGFYAQYLFNGKRFSFRGAFLQNEVQLRSAGSFILGGGMNNVSVRADSSVLPTLIAEQGYFDDFHFRSSTVQSFTFQAGYGYTYVFKQGFFATLAATAGPGFNYTFMRQSSGGYVSGFGTDLAGTLRAGFGYNTRRWFAGFHYLGTLTVSNTPVIFARQQFGSANFRISVARRFSLKKNLFGIY